MKKYGGKRDRRPFVGIHKHVLFGCEEWARLSTHAKLLYLLMKGKRNPMKNNGKVKLTYREIKKINYQGLKSQKYITRAFEELIKEGWIKKVERGGLYGKANFYEITGKYDEYGMK